MSPIPSIDPANVGNAPGAGPLRAGGVIANDVASPEKNLPSTRSKRAKRQIPALHVVRDCAAGAERMREAGTLYLPQDPGEKPDAYQNRLRRSVFFNAFGETVEGLTGFVFTKDPVFGDDVPPVIREHAENIDNAGTHLYVFLRRLFQDAITAGHAGILVDFPTTGGLQSARDEQAGIRPYFVPIRKEDIVSWRTITVNGKTVLAQLVIEECTTEPDGAFGEKEVTNYRVLYRDNDGNIRGKLLHVNEDKSVTILREWDYPTQTEIPFAELTTSGYHGMLESKPPLLDLAYLNIAHYQMWSDRATSIHKTCVPVWVETGVDAPRDGAAETIVIGPNTARRFTNPQAKAGYQSHDGAALGEVSKVIEDLKSDMSILGLAMLAPQKRTAETLGAKRMDKAATDSKLGMAVAGAQDAAEHAMEFYAKYLKLPSGGSIRLNRDFESAVMTPELMIAYATLAEKLGLPIRVVLEALQAGGRIPEDADLDELEKEMLANAAAAAAQRELERQAAVQSRQLEAAA